ncbi:uncharacterized protein At1g65710-like [Andrographis paniculata]|uniref:uncharacterized protein At1g65710-like n=1 Tax=Andrographis paniculata TaxID=175694 RepID=UPI0021E7C1D2|nr:uncharacterized protein At1g65710-like [Andrographis paniculata]
MGTCLSKKSVCATAPVTAPVADPAPAESQTAEEQGLIKKEIFVIKHRTSHEIERRKAEEEKGEGGGAEEVAGKCESGSSGNAAPPVGGGAAVVRSSSCTKEEVDAILIQCGRLSRSASAGKPGQSSEIGGRKYSGSKRSFDFDNDTGKSDGNTGDDERELRRRERHRHSPSRRRTPSRERDRDPTRSTSRERTGNGGRRVSRSPGRRSESPNSSKPNSEPNPNANSKPSKMVSVPATVPPPAAAADPNSSTAIKRIQVKRNAATSPRARSPARTLSRSNSRKTDNSPYRRNPLAEIDNNVSSQNCRKTSKLEEPVHGQTFVLSENLAMNVIPSSGIRSSRQSRDFDNNNDAIPNPNPNPNVTSSYTALLLEDIQNFHQKKNSNNSPAPELPACVVKAQSILEAVADLNMIGGENRGSSRIRQHPVMESEVVGDEDDLTQPSFHKYVTVRRGTAADTAATEEQQESSGSNSLQQQQWLSSSSLSGWEPNSAESTDRWTCSSSSRAVGKQSSVAAAPVTSESGNGAKRGTKKREYSDHQNGIGRGRVASRGSHAAAAST